MNSIELLQGEIAAMSARVKRLEVIFQSRGVISQDTTDAERLAEAMGFETEVIFLPRDAGTKKYARERKRLARRLQREKKWPAERIARTMGCSYRTVERWIH